MRRTRPRSRPCRTRSPGPPTPARPPESTARTARSLAPQARTASRTLAESKVRTAELGAEPRAGRAAARLSKKTPLAQLSLSKCRARTVSHSSAPPDTAHRRGPRARTRTRTRSLLDPRDGRLARGLWLEELLVDALWRVAQAVLLLGAARVEHLALELGRLVDRLGEVARAAGGRASEGKEERGEGESVSARRFAVEALLLALVYKSARERHGGAQAERARRRTARSLPRRRRSPTSPSGRRGTRAAPARACRRRRACRSRAPSRCAGWRRPTRRGQSASRACTGSRRCCVANVHLFESALPHREWEDEDGRRKRDAPLHALGVVRVAALALALLPQAHRAVVRARDKLATGRRPVARHDPVRIIRFEAITRQCLSALRERAWVRGRGGRTRRRDP